MTAGQDRLFSVTITRGELDAAEERRRVLERLHVAWSARPDVTLGELVAGAAALVTHDADPSPLADDELVDAALEFAYAPLIAKAVAS